MSGSSPLRAALLLVASLSSLAMSGCEGDKPTTAADAGAPDAGTGPALDPKLSAAVAAAASADRGAQSADGPPETGVFPPGKADALVPPTAASKVELMSDGAEPRVKLGPKLDGGGEQKVVLAIGVRTGAQSALPTIDYSLTLKAEKAKEGEGGGGLRVLGKVTGAKLSPLQPGQLPKELEAEVAKLKGSTVKYEISPVDGATSGWKTELAKGAPPALEATLQALADGLAALNVPVPQKPVGSGAYWMVSDRAVVAGIDVVRYRVFRVHKIDDKMASLSIELRQYAASEAINLGASAKPGEFALDLFDSQGKGEAALTVGALFPGGGELGQKVQARLKTPGAQPRGGQRPAIQLETTAKIGGDAE